MPAARHNLLGTWVPDHPRKRTITVESDTGDRVTYRATFATGVRSKTVKRVAIQRWIVKHKAVKQA